MDRLRREDIARALESLAAELEGAREPVELILVGGAALVLLYGPGRELKARYAFEDLWEAERAS